MYASPLAIVGLVIRTKSVEFMPLPITITGTMCSFIWGSYGLYVGDMYITICNVAGAFLGLVQLAVYAQYGCGSRWWCGGGKRGGGAEEDADLNKLLFSPTWEGRTPLVRGRKSQDRGGAAADSIDAATRDRAQSLDLAITMGYAPAGVSAFGPSDLLKLGTLLRKPKGQTPLIRAAVSVPADLSSMTGNLSDYSLLQQEGKRGGGGGGTNHLGGPGGGAGEEAHREKP